MVSTVGSTAVVMAIPNQVPILPAWCAVPDKAGQSRLATLGQELGMLLLPDDVVAEDCRQRWVQHLGQVLERGKFADEAVLLLQVKTDGDLILPLLMAWPAHDAAAVLAEAAIPAASQPFQAERVRKQNRHARNRFGLNRLPALLRRGAGPPRCRICRAIRGAC